MNARDRPAATDELDRIGLFLHLRTIFKAAGGQKAWADAHGFSESYVSDIINSKRSASDAVLKAAGYRRIEHFVPLKNSANG